MGCIFTEINGGPLPCSKAADGMFHFADKLTTCRYEGINTLAELTREMLVNRRTFASTCDSLRAYQIRTPSIPPFVAEPLQATAELER